MDEPDILEAIGHVRTAHEAADRALALVQNGLRDAGAPAHSQVRANLLLCADGWLAETQELSRRTLNVAGNLQRTIELYRALEQDLHDSFQGLERRL